MPGRRPPKRLVEDACVLSARAAAAIPVRGSSVLDAGGAARLTVEADRTAPDAVRLTYWLRAADYSYAVRLVAVPQHFGGARWLLHCPLRGCGRRARALYLPSGARYFGCRQCHDLTYRSVQDPVRTRLERLADELLRYEQMIASGTAVDALGGIAGARDCIAAFRALVCKTS